MNYLSVCSGIEAASCAWHPMGWRPVGFSEIEAFPSAVLAHRFPEVKNYGDMTAAVLFESESVRGCPTPSRKSWENTTICPTLRAGGNRTGGDRPPGTDVDTCESLQIVGGVDYEGNPHGPIDPTGPLLKGSPTGGDHPLPAIAVQYFENHPNDSRVTGPHEIGNTVSSRYGTGGGNTPLVEKLPVLMDQGGSVMSVEYDMVGTLRRETKGHEPVIPVHTTGAGFWQYGFGTLRARAQDSHENLMVGSAVRRLTPREYERLQGFSDDWTQIPWKKKPAEVCPDGPRYKAIGNSMAVPVMAWIGRRIQQVEEALHHDAIRRLS